MEVIFLPSHNTGKLQCSPAVLVWQRAIWPPQGSTTICLLCSYTLPQATAAGVCWRWAGGPRGPLVSPSSTYVLISSASQINSQSRQEHLEAQTVVATELLCRKQLGYIHSTEAWAINIRLSLVCIWGAIETAGLTTLPDWPCLLCSLSFRAIVSTR